MTTPYPTIRLKVSQAPQLKARVASVFPANVVATDGIAVAKANGTYTFTLSLDDFARAGSVPDTSVSAFPFYDSATSTTSLITYDNLATEISGSLGHALTKTDDTNVTLTLGGTPTTALLQATSITVGWTGTLGLSRGGTHADLSATGGTSQVLKQTSVGGAVTVAQLAASDLSNGTTGTTSVVLSTTPTLTGQPVVQGLTTTSPGWYAQVTADTTPRVRVGLNATDVASISFGPGNANRDAFIERAGAGALRFGSPDAAAPVAQTLSVQNVVAGTSNTAGTALTIAGSQGTGTGVGGSILFKVAPAGSTGTAQNALATALTIDSTKLATFAAGISATTGLLTTASANALAVGPAGTTNPSLNIDASTASAATGLNIKSAAAAGGLAVSVLSSGTDENLKIDAKGAGTITLGGTSTGAIVNTRATTLSAALTYGGVTLSNAVTGTGNMVLATSPTLTTPTLGVATATSINKVTITAPATSSVLTIADGKSLAVNNSLGLSAVDNKTLTFNNNLTLAGTDATTITFQGTDTYVGRATTDTLTNKTLTSPTISSPTLSGTVAGANTIPLSILAQSAAYSLLGNTTGSTANNTAFTIGGLTLKASPASSDIVLLQDEAASHALKYTTVSALASAGSVGSVNGLTGSAVIGGVTNIGFAVTAASSALTIALKGADGNDPSASNVVSIDFRNATGTTGTPSTLQVTAASSLVISSGSTMGVTSSKAFRIWIVGFNDGGTFRLGAINCSTATATYQLSDDSLVSSTAEGGAGAADSAGVFYTGTAVTTKAYRILGYAEWNATGLTAGTWTTTNLSKVQLFGPGVNKPGNIVQTQFTYTTTESSTTANTPQVSNATVSITPSSAANLVLANVSTGAKNLTANNVLQAFLYRDSTQLTATWNSLWGSGSPLEAPFGLIYLEKPNTTSSTTYKLEFLSSNGVNPVSVCFGVGMIMAQEIMG